MSKKPGSSTSRMYAQRMADGLRHTLLLLVPHQRHRPCGEAMPTRGHRRPVKSCGGFLAGCRCNIDETAVCFVLTRVLCVCCVFFSTTGQRKKSSSCCGLSGATHAYRCIAQHAPRTHCPLTAIEAAAKAGKDMRRRVGRVQM